MKVLSLKQPWAELILQGRKKIDLRKWNTKFRGIFLIHASKKPDDNAMKMFGFKNLLCGFIIGKVELIGVKDYRKNKKEFINDKDLHLADESYGGFGFVLKNVKRINPVFAKGKLRFWEYNSKIFN